MTRLLSASLSLRCSLESLLHCVGRRPTQAWSSSRRFSVHCEVAIPGKEHPIDGGGFLTDNDNGKRELNPSLCGVAGKTLLKARRILPCPAASVKTRTVGTSEGVKFVDLSVRHMAAKQLAILPGVPHMEITSKTDVLFSMIAGFLTAAGASKSGSGTNGH